MPEGPMARVDKIMSIGAASRVQFERLVGLRQPQQRVAAGAMIARFAEQQIKGYARNVIGHGFNARVLFLIEDFAISAALLAGFRAHRGSARVGDGPSAVLLAAD